MKCDIVVCGVGGQGVLSVAALIGAAALKDGLSVKQSEVHGMSQRGGAVSAHLRLADGPIWSDIIPRGTADLILSMEPLEVFRYFDYLRPEGSIVTASGPVKNIPAYPDERRILERLRTFGRVTVVDADHLAKQAGLTRSANVVLAGAAAEHLPIGPVTIESHIREAFAAKGPAAVEANVRAFRLGREAA